MEKSTRDKPLFANSSIGAHTTSMAKQITAYTGEKVRSTDPLLYPDRGLHPHSLRAGSAPPPHFKRPQASTSKRISLNLKLVKPYFTTEAFSRDTLLETG